MGKIDLVHEIVQLKYFSKDRTVTDILLTITITSRGISMIINGATTHQFLVADVAGLADADDHDFPAAVQHAAEDLHRLAEAVGEPPGHGFQAGGFGFDHPAGEREIVHAA